MTTAAHVFVALVALPCIAFIILLVRKRVLRVKYAVVWVLIGMVLTVLVIWPGLVDLLANVFGVDYAPSLLFTGAIVVLLAVIVHHSLEISRLEASVRLLAQRSALDSVEHQPQDIDA